MTPTFSEAVLFIWDKTRKSGFETENFISKRYKKIKKTKYKFISLTMYNSFARDVKFGLIQ